MIGTKELKVKENDIYKGKTAKIYSYIKELNENEIDKLLKYKVNDICEIIIKDKNRDFTNYCGKLFSKMPPDILKDAIQYISENSEKIVATKNTIDSDDIASNFVKMLINNISEEVIKEKSESLKKIINDRKSEFDEITNVCSMIEENGKTDSANVLDMIDFICNKDLYYKKMKEIGIKELVNGIDIEKFELLLDYGLQKDKYALVNDDFISDIYQAADANFGLRNLKNKFEDVKNNSEIPEMNKYEQEVNSLADMDETQFDNFIEDIKKLKNCEGTIPEKYCDYLIKQKLNSESILNQHLEKYWPVFKRVFEDKRRHVLSEYGIDDYIVQVTDKLDEETLGVQGFRYIRFNEQQIKDLSEKNMDALDTLFHEARHAYQNKRIYNDKIYTSDQYKMLKEDIIKQKKPNFYKENYIKMYKEIDARIHGKIGAYKYLKQLGFSNKKILDNEGKDFMECYIEQQKLERRVYNSAKIKKDDDGKKRDMKKIFRNILIDNTDFLERYPVLSIEYDENGERRSGFSILEDYEQALNEATPIQKKQIDNRLMLIPSILNDRGPVLNTITMEDSEKTLKFHTENKIVKKYRDVIIRNEILSLIEKRIKEKKVYLENPKESDELARDNYNRIVSNLREFAIKNPEEEISKIILETIMEKEEKSEEIDALKDIDNSVKPEERNEGKAVIKVINKSKNDKNIQVEKNKE